MNRLMTIIIFCLLTFAAQAETALATFAGGCFWCMEPPYDKLEGVISTTSGYSGGNVKNPSYKQVSSGQTGHYESMQVKYDPARVSFEKLLELFWQNVDFVDNGGQFCDRGPQYRTAIFYHDAEQKEAAKLSKEALQKKIGADNQVVTQILPLEEFYPAEDYHQDYYEKNPIRYEFYRYSCGRDKRLEKIKETLTHD